MMLMLLLLLMMMMMSVSPTSVASMSYRQLEDFINKWTLELEEQEAIFLEQATQVNAWDRLLIDNGDKVCLPVYYFFQYLMPIFWLKECRKQSRGQITCER